MHVHSHGGDAHDHSRVTDRRAISIALGLIVTFMGAEVAAGIVAGSLARSARGRGERFDLHHTTLQVDHLARRSQGVALELHDAGSGH